jgi:hypothetical protein
MNKEKYIKILVLLDRSRELCAREDKHLWEELFYVLNGLGIRVVRSAG